METSQKIYSVTELNHAVRIALENKIGEVWVEGEISRFTRHTSSHWYFTLKDETAAISCAMFGKNNACVAFTPKDGQKVRIFGRASLYETRGAYQLIVRQMVDEGKGTLQEQFEERKKKLAAEGLFDTDRKKPLPMLPQRIGVVTSPTGAAVCDMIEVLTRRFPNLEILLAPVTVQGDGAAKSIAAAINYLNQIDIHKASSLLKHPMDVLLVGRGGGSLEDLWAFNEEIVARAIAASHIPIISAVGHEIDFTIADFVADVRAPTPSAAAELAVREKVELNAAIARLSTRLSSVLKNKTRVLRGQIPSFRQTMTHLLQSGIQQRQQRVDQSSMILSHRLQNAVTEQKQNLKRLTLQIRALSPFRVLERGYSLTQTEDGTVVREIEQLKPGDLLITRLVKGTIRSEVKEKEIFK